MADASLAKYVKDQLKAGYEITPIRNSLIRQGNSAADVDDAIKEAKPKLPLVWIAIALIVLVILVLSVLVYIKLQTPAEEVFVPTEEIKIEKEEISREEIIEKEEIDLDKIPIPPAEQVSVKEEATQDFESSMKIEEIRTISLTEPERAEALCNDLNTKTEKDNCYLQVAGASSKPEFCGKVSSQIPRDQCYFNFAVIGYKTCGNIQDETIKKNCEQMISLNITGP